MGSNVDKFDIGSLTTYRAGAAQAAMHRMVQKMTDDILRPFGVTKMQWMIIGAVMDAGKAGVRISDIADTLGTTIAYLTNSINILESRNILERRDNLEDSRSKLVSVVPSYLDTCKLIETTMRKELRKSIYSKVDREEFITYWKVLFQLIEVGKAEEKAAQAAAKR